MDVSKKRVLLTLHTNVAFQTIKRHYSLLQSDQRLSFAVTTVDDDHYAGSIQHDALYFQKPHIPFEEATQQDWDMVLFASHGKAHMFPFHTPTVHLQHGMGGGKMAKGVNYTWGKRWVSRDERPIYNLFLEASYRDQERAIAMTPLLEGYIRVVGDLACDATLARVPQREAIRERLGIQKEQTAVLVMASWGEANLFSQFHEQLLDAIARNPQFFYLFALHPHLYLTQDVAGMITSQLAKTPVCYYIRQHNETVEDLLVASDIALSDHTSLNLVYSLLDKPILQVPIPLDAMSEQSPIWELSQFTPKIYDWDHLDRLVQTQLTDFPHDRLRAFAYSINSYPGEAAPRTLQALYDLMRLSPPTNAYSKAL